ncbi:hypothetical protein P153DRAFT_432797 [Dothidotthia symphoricarpi CBS 119687]|uniref:TPR-like protein n=1 Tax=Dothidotthia symphoricarpi CBS 119687 TaxID=1392245 RepID=A0A6A6A751_9PLEO|nr:uncharacterized protein P153DRAFT_432797 [Dothidotthia symphoricarpi CBS 119687]KAF2127729.1 hypothetical protein P153DRAFT_432797 [Dothidotthia symphoricarpi CBS 119687]
MLERASTCLESGGRQLFRAPKPCLRTRRTLHAAFWHHGAGDLALPASWAASSTLDRAGGDTGEVAVAGGKTASAAPNGALLDFLYPEKTLALLRRLSTPGLDVVDLRRGAGVRRFSTTPWQSQQLATTADGSNAEEPAVILARAQMAKRLLHQSETEALQELLREQEHGGQELAWQLYSAMSDKQLSSLDPAISADLLDYLTLDGDPAVPSRVIDIFDALPPPHRRPSSYRAAIVAYIALRQVAPAILLHEQISANEGPDTLNIGTNTILRRTVFNEQWDLSLRVFRTFMRLNPKFSGQYITNHVRGGFAYPLSEVWNEAAQLPDLHEYLDSFFRYVREVQDELESSEETAQSLKLFVMTFVPHVMDQILTARRPDEDFIWNWFIKLFDTLRDLQLPTHVCYEHAIKRILEQVRYTDYTNQRKIWLELYRRYRKQYLYLQDPKPDGKPSHNLLRLLIGRHGFNSSLDRVQDLVKDIRTFYPNRPIQAGTLEFLVHLFAQHGETDYVHEYFQEYQSYYEDRISLKILSALPFVYARRVDVTKTKEQFDRISTEFGLTPDVACWNILLLAYVRADDLDGALECFNNCLDSGVRPDHYTFNPMLDFCAKRGDIEAFEALYSKGKQMGIPLDNNVRARSGYVQAFLSADDPDGAEAIAQGMLKAWKAGTLRGDPLTHTWNLLIQFHALNGDVANARRFYKEMIQHGIPLDSWTYGSLMRSLIEIKQTNAAYKILRVNMVENNMRVYALHYAIVMTGFLKEGQHTLAMDAYERMVARNVDHTEASRQASILTMGITQLTSLKKRRAKNPKHRLKYVEQALRQMLFLGGGREIAHRQPRHLRQLDQHGHLAVPESYYGLLITLYNTRGAYKICQDLFREAEAVGANEDNYHSPLTLLTAIMDAHLKAGEHAEIAKCWDLARLQADKLVKTFHQALHPAPPPPESDSLVDAAVIERFQTSHIAANRRHLLTKATQIYIRSLVKQGGIEDTQQAQRTIRDLLINGFVVDNFTWNEFVQHLALTGHLTMAFSVCELYLMPRFPGWRELVPHYIRNERQGYQWMELRHYDITRTAVLPRYKTLVVLASAFSDVRRDESMGVGFDPVTEQWMKEMLEEKAPLTVRAIETMPRTNDRLQERYLYSPGSSYCLYIVLLPSYLRSPFSIFPSPSSLSHPLHHFHTQSKHTSHPPIIPAKHTFNNYTTTIQQRQPDSIKYTCLNSDAFLHLCEPSSQYLNSLTFGCVELSYLDPWVPN